MRLPGASQVALICREEQARPQTGIMSTAYKAVECTAALFTHSNTIDSLLWNLGTLATLLVISSFYLVNSLKSYSQDSHFNIGIW